MQRRQFLAAAAALAALPQPASADSTAPGEIVTPLQSYKGSSGTNIAIYLFRDIEMLQSHKGSSGTRADVEHGSDVAPASIPQG